MKKMLLQWRLPMVAKSTFLILLLSIGRLNAQVINQSFETTDWVTFSACTLVQLQQILQVPVPSIMELGLTDQEMFKQLLLIQELQVNHFL
jgi:uncharacterized membrane protein YcjF (UPF0283 family)